ncbi:MAG: RNA methyltransferase [Saprospiraceae bacterium]|nr:RNA methyltransferase [Saprospiraceae bacterium]
MEVPQVSKGQLRFLQSLKLKKYRQKYGSFLVEGRKAVSEILTDNVLTVKSLYAIAEWIVEQSHLLETKNIPLYQVDPRGLKQISSQKTPDQVVIECQIPEPPLPSLESGWLLFLDGLNDPGNLGTIIRSADWFGVSHIVMTPGTVDCYNPKCIQSSMGSIGRIPLHYLSIQTLKEFLPRHPILLADASGTPVADIDVPDGGILVIGSESHGISNDIYQFEHLAVSLPKAAGSRAESLNAAMAATALLAILCA